MGGGGLYNTQILQTICATAFRYETRDYNLLVGNHSTKPYVVLKLPFGDFILY